MVLSVLPVEILSHIARYSSLNGDIGSLRLASSLYNKIAIQQAALFLRDLRSTFGVSSRALELYSAHKTGGRALSVVVNLGDFIKSVHDIAAEADNAIAVDQFIAPPVSRFGSRENFVLFSAFSQSIRRLTTESSGPGDVLAPVGSDAFVAMQFSEPLEDLIDRNLTLSELESIIATINICATRLWSGIFLFGGDASVSSFGSLSGYSFNIEQAILTEHVIWGGPEWVALTLEAYQQKKVRLPRPSGAVSISSEDIIRHGPWRGSKEDGARLAANGLARFLWKKRQHKFEDELARQAAARKQVVRQLSVNPAVWRGSAGDM